MSEQSMTALSAGTNRTAPDWLRRLFAISGFFQHAQLGAARARVFRQFCRARLNGLALDPFQGRRLWLAQFGHIDRAGEGVTPRLLATELLDHAILQGMERDHRQA